MNPRKIIGIKLIILCLILLTPVITWAVYKPVRVLAPQWVEQISCPSPHICLDNPVLFSQAETLYQTALSLTSRDVGSFKKPPRVVFCTTRQCFRSFGFNRASATAVGKFGIVVSPRAWKDYYLRHEMIHHRQAEELGIFYILTKPQWLLEGMAYSLSEDPRPSLSQPWQGYREKFSDWYQDVGQTHLWQAAEKL